MITNPEARPAPSPAREDSHTFSLEALRARETAWTPRTAQAADDSGVIDLDALRGAVTLADPMATTRLLPPPAEPAPASRPTPRWAVATVGLLGGAVVALAAVVGVGLEERTPAIQDPAPRPTMAIAASVADMGPELETKAPSPAPVVAEAPVDPAPEVEAAPAPPPEKPAKTSSRRSSKKARSKSKPAAKTRAASKPKAAPTPKPKADDDLSVNCILDPASCGRGGKKAPSAKPKAPASNLPEKLSSSQIRKALTGPKARAKQCADMHAAPAGTTVKVKLSIAGSGEVRSATPQAPHVNGLGRCVANALGTAQFDAFAKPAMGVVYSVRL